MPVSRARRPDLGDGWKRLYAASWAPQLLQNRAPTGFAAPHWLQNRPPGAGGFAGPLVGVEAEGALGFWLISSRKDSVISFVPLRNSLRARPNPRPMSGSREGPKTSSATMAITIMCQGCNPNGIVPSLRMLRRKECCLGVIIHPASRGTNEENRRAGFRCAQGARAKLLPHRFLRLAIESSNPLPGALRHLVPHGEGAGKAGSNPGERGRGERAERDCPTWDWCRRAGLPQEWCGSQRLVFP